MRTVGSGTGEGLRKASSRVVLNIPETSYSSDYAGRRPGTAQQGGNKTFTQKYDTLLVLLGIVIVLSVVGLFFVHSFYLNSVRVGDTVLPGQQKLGGGLVGPSVAAAGRASL